MTESSGLSESDLDTNEDLFRQGLTPISPSDADWIPPNRENKNHWFKKNKG